VNGSVLDTNVITKLLDKDPAAVSLVREFDKLFTSAIVVGELYFAAVNSSKREANLKNFEDALSCMEIIPINDKVCMAYAEIKLELKKKGKTIPDNDIWIAACAHAHNLSVATFDHHFSEISQIELVRV
jgi:tRNA(fMet)-specific endonuclease VapC